MLIASLRTPRSIRLALFALLIVASGCGSSGPTNLNPSPSDDSVANVPDWFVAPPEDASAVFGTGTATSRSLQTAVDKASTTARGDIASGLATRFQGLSKQFEEEIGVGADSEMLQQFTQAQKEVVSEVLRGASTRKRDIQNDRGVYRAYVLMGMPIGRAAAELLRKIQSNKALHTRFRSTQAFEELEEEVRDYEADRDSASQ